MCGDSICDNCGRTLWDCECDHPMLDDDEFDLDEGTPAPGSYDGGRTTGNTHDSRVRGGGSETMAKCTKDSKHTLEFEHGHRFVCFNWDKDYGLEIFVQPDNMPALTTKQVRKVANRIIEWCGEAEGK